MNLEDISIYCKICQEETFFKASEHEHMSQSAISKTILRLEDFLGKKLIERSRGKHKITLTHDGEIFLNYANKIEETITEMNKHFLLNDFRHIPILITDYAMEQNVSKIFNQYEKLCLFKEDTCRQLNVQQGEIRIIESPIKLDSNPHFETTLFYQEELFLVCSKDNTLTDYSDYRALSFIQSQVNSSLAHSVQIFFDLYKIPKNNIVIREDLQIVKNMLTLSNRVTILPASFIGSNDALQKIPLSHKLFYYHYLVNSTTMSAKEQEVLELIKDKLLSLESITVK
ncbi:TPA: LysR family transcriptional regulator [Enterococcus faecalis]|nr:LysR family transcriptional regulator [Enterococcus faecalis]EKQ3613731.1 LysR family transcriptional regulator [Enterococcus faecalis]